MAKSYRYFITCPTGFEYQLVKELSGIGVSPAIQKRGGATFEGSFADGLKACLWSRIGGKVLLAIEDFHITCEKDIYETSRRVRWSNFFAAEKSISIECTSLSRNYNNASYLSLLVKDGIADHFRGVCGKRPDVDKDEPDVRINLFVERDTCTLSIDLSGGSLHRRGYRTWGGEAPLKENLAAALLGRAGWKESGKPSKGDTNTALEEIREQQLIDPMCGSGTFLIEAAMIAASIAPGLLVDSVRMFSFKHLKQFKREEWEQLKEEAREKKQLSVFTSGAVTIRGFDLDRGVVAAARDNIKAAGLEKFISVNQADINEIEKHLEDDEALTSKLSTSELNLVAVNLPYGKRIGDDEDLAPLYTLTGEKFKKYFNGWKVLTISGSEDLSRAIGMKAIQVNSVYNGPIKCVSAIFQVNDRYRKEKEDDGSVSPEKEHPFFSTELSNRLKKNIKNLRKWKEKEGVSCYRIYDADLPEYAAAIDMYEGEYLYIQEYAPPADIPPAKAQKRLDTIVHTVGKVTEIGRSNISMRQRKRQRGADQYSKTSQTGKLEQIHEGGLSFYVNFNDYLDTGIFTDHRIIRSMIRDWAAGKKFLNLFSYTAVASVYAAWGGAVCTTSVDSSSVYCNWAAKNFDLNGIRSVLIEGKEAEKKDYSSQNIIVKSDCMEYLESQAFKNSFFDIIFIDPPTFSNSKSRTSDFDIQRDHPHLIEKAFAKLEKNGVIIFSTNFHRFKIDDAINEKFKVTDITEKTSSPDFAQRGNRRKCFLLVKEE